jgi:hypothetical protein
MFLSCHAHISAACYNSQLTKLNYVSSLESTSNQEHLSWTSSFWYMPITLELVPSQDSPNSIYFYIFLLIHIHIPGVFQFSVHQSYLFPLELPFPWTISNHVYSSCRYFFPSLSHFCGLLFQEQFKEFFPDTPTSPDYCQDALSFTYFFSGLKME